MKNSWDLSDIQQGDSVALCRGSEVVVVTVERATKLHVVVNGTKYRRNGGSAVGGLRFDRNHVCRLSDDMAARVMRTHAQRAARKLSNQLRYLSAEQCVAIVADVTGLLKKVDALPGDDVA